MGGPRVSGGGQPENRGRFGGRARHVQEELRGSVPGAPRTNTPVKPDRGARPGRCSDPPDARSPGLPGAWAAWGAAGARLWAGRAVKKASPDVTHPGAPQAQGGDGREGAPFLGRASSTSSLSLPASPCEQTEFETPSALPPAQVGLRGPQALREVGRGRVFLLKTLSFPHQKPCQS